MTDRTVRIIGIGASAGGLDALTRLVRALPPTPGVAIVVLQHLAESQTEAMRAILGTHTKLPIIDTEHDAVIEADRIYVVPPHAVVRIRSGIFEVERAAVGLRPDRPIDTLLISLATALGRISVGVVLSGAANDGTAGLQAIKQAGGVTIAQEPGTAMFDEMPRSAIASGVVDYILSPEQIGTSIATYQPMPGPGTGDTISRILTQLRDLAGIDFTMYKRSTILRRLERQVLHHRLGSLEEYARYLADHPNAATVLYEDLLIHVTEFFRDAPVLEDVATHIIPAILDAKPAGEPIRAWVPGCSTGEEAYSIAMLLHEAVGSSDRQIQVFGSDLSERAIEIAREGHFPASIAERVSEERLRRFFRASRDGWTVAPELRESCLFVRHDVAVDPPFSRIDLLTCRNVLVYLSPALQKRVIPILHFALTQPGYLVLGRAESIVGFDTLFTAFSPGLPIYTRNPAPRATGLAFHRATPPVIRRHGELTNQRLDVQRDADHALLARYAPPSVVVDGNFEIIQFRGRTGAYLEPMPGPPQYDVIRMAREGLGSELRQALRRCEQSGLAVRTPNLLVRNGDETRRITLEVLPLRGGIGAQRHFLVVFEDGTLHEVTSAKSGNGSPAGPGLHDELEAAKELLASLTAQHAATYEELEVLNEELQSANEELQSGNEHLQVAKEELQASNEELETVNRELADSNALLQGVNDDLINLLASVDIPIIIVDNERRLRRFTPRARDILKLIPSDVGRPISDLKPTVGIDDLDEAIAKVISSLATYEREVSDVGTYRMQIRPYRRLDDKIGGAIVSFVDVTSLRRLVNELREARDDATAIIETVPTPLLTLDSRLRVCTANRAAAELFSITASELAGAAFTALGSGSWRDAAELRGRLANVVATRAPIDNLDLEYALDGEPRQLLATARLLAGGDPAVLLVSLVDVTAQRVAEKVREDEVAERASRFERDQLLGAVSHELRTPLNAILLWAQALRDLPLDDPRKAQGLETIVQSARAQTQLIDDLFEVAFSRGPETKLLVNLEPIDPATAVLAAIDAVRGDATTKGIRIEETVSTGLQVQADTRRLQQITWNLVGNAIKFTPSGGRITISLTGVARGVELRVSDTGAGIAPEMLERVFEPFSQRTQTPSHMRMPGLGIRLALVQKLVQQHGGTITVESEGLGRGAAFTVTLPRD